jgi:hypothetical protein
MKTLVAVLAFLVLLAPRVWANCTITGTVFNPDGSPLANGTVQFNSVVQQTLQGGAVIPPTQVSTPTNASGVMAPISLVPGLQGQFVFCSPAAGGCGNPTPVLIPIATTADISSILIGIQLQTGANVNAASLNVTGNTTMGGSLVVGGPTTINNTLNVSGTTSVGGSLNVTGPSSLAATVTIPSTSTTPTIMLFPNGAGSISSSTFSSIQWAEGTHLSASDIWIADATSANFIDAYGGIIQLYFGEGLTVGSPWDPYGGGSGPLASSEINFVDPNYAGISNAGMGISVGNITLNNGGINVTGGTAGGGIVSNYATNGPAYIDTTNSSSGVSAAAVTRSSNGTHVADLGMVGLSGNLGGYFTYDRGYVSSNGAQGLLIEATGVGAGAKLYLGAPNANEVRLLANAHFGVANDGVAGPTVASCGGSDYQLYGPPSDMAGWVRTGTTPNTGCQVTFAAGFATQPVCVCSTQAQGIGCSLLPGSGGFSVAFTQTVTALWFSYICIETGA